MIEEFKLLGYILGSEVIYAYMQTGPRFVPIPLNAKLGRPATVMGSVGRSGALPE